MVKSSPIKVNSYNEEEKRVIARWAGEAAKEWWTRLDDAGRQQISKMRAHEIFELGWMACRASEATKRLVNNDDPDGGDDGSGFGS